MTTAIIFHEVQDGTVWAKAWKKGPGSRHEMFGELGIKCRTFREPNNPNATGIMAEIPDMGKFNELLQSAEGQKAMRGGRPEGRDNANVGRVHLIAGEQVEPERPQIPQENRL
jgi:hypothetical protein